MKPDADDKNFTLHQSGIFGPQKQASRLPTQRHPGLGLGMGCVFRRCSGNLCFLGSNSRACGNKQMPAHAELYQPGELWVLKLFRAPCHSSGYPELIRMRRWNCCFRDPEKLLRWGCSASEGREGWGYSGSEGGQHVRAHGACRGWWETSVHPASAEAIDSVLRVAQLESPECSSRPKAAFVLCSENVFLKEACGWLNADLKKPNKARRSHLKSSSSTSLVGHWNLKSLLFSIHFLQPFAACLAQNCW